MMSKFDLKKVAKKVLRKRPTSQSLQIMHPKRDWSVGVLIALLIILGTTVWGGSAYLDTRTTINVNDIAADVESVVYRESNVTEALRIRGERRIDIDYSFENIEVDAPEEEMSTTTSEVIDEEVSQDRVMTDNGGDTATTSDQTE